MIFTGQYEHTIDAKNRLAIPADIRAKWSTELQGESWQAIPWPGGMIRLYPEKAFAAAASEGGLTLTPDEDAAELEASLFGLSSRLEIDSAGRVRLPEEMLGLVGLGKSVVLVGARDRLEIRDREAWVAERQQRLAQIPDLMRRVRSGAGGSSAG